MHKDAVMLTFDVDWAPDWMVAEVANLLTNRGVAATWFITHESPILEDLKSEKLFELGWHPNFFPGSSHGENVEDVLEFCRNLVPEGRSVRAHSLFQSERHLQTLVTNFDIRNDCSVYLPTREVLGPHQVRYEEEGRPLRRLPHFFQDNMNILGDRRWDAEDAWFHRKGAKTFCLHPIHICLNTNRMEQYEKLKALGPLPSITRTALSDIDRDGTGTRSLFLGLLETYDHRLFSQVDAYCEAVFGGHS